MARSGLTTEELKDGVLQLRLSRPEKLNTLIEPMRQELAGTLESLREREDVRVCVITGEGRGFCAGGDIEVMERIIREEAFEQLQTFLAWGKAIVQGIRALPIPVIAAVNGPAAGAGMNLALACDLRIASTAARFSQSFIHIGLHPDWGGTYFLPRMVGPSRALELFWTGRVVDAQEAHELGLVDLLVPEAEFREKVDAFARTLASRPREVLALSKLGVYEGLRGDLESVLMHEAISQAECIRSPAARAGIRRFLEKKRRAEVG